MKLPARFFSVESKQAWNQRKPGGQSDAAHNYNVKANSEAMSLSAALNSMPITSNFKKIPSVAFMKKGLAVWLLSY